MSRAIAVHVVAGILFVGVGTPHAQESIPRTAVVEATETLTTTGVLPTRNDSSSPKHDMLESAVLFRLDCIDGIEGDVGIKVAVAPQAKAGTARRWFSDAVLWTLGFLVGGLVNAGGR